MVTGTPALGDALANTFLIALPILLPKLPCQARELRDAGVNKLVPLFEASSPPTSSVWIGGRSFLFADTTGSSNPVSFPLSSEEILYEEEPPEPVAFPAEDSSVVAVYFTFKPENDV